VHVIGDITGALGFPGSRLYARFKIICNTQHWHVMQGAEEGYTQVDEATGEGSAVWNHPIDVHFGTDSLSGWPRVLVEVWSVDGYDRSELAGYGMIFVPTSPGTYDLDCVTWRPQGTLGDQLSAALLGAPPNLMEVTTAASGADRFELRTETAGTVVFHLEILAAGFAERNVRMGAGRAVTCL
ncbi:unnamed protein product, partial [Ectocarpus sp. 12 AP-2014]